jgi:hypothetical protein
MIRLQSDLGAVNLHSPQSARGRDREMADQERLDAVEIKVTFSGPAADQATTVLGLRGAGERRRVYFCEDRRVTDPATLRLLDARIILRIRRDPDGDDATVKLRECFRDQLAPPPWLDVFSDGKHKFKVEQDWAGPRKVLSASLVAKRDPGRLDDVLAARESPRTLFSDRQRQFLADCAGTDVDLDAVTLLGPVRVGKWDTTTWSGFEVDAERWTVDPLDFLELSIRVDPDRAGTAQAGFEAALRDAGIGADPVQETKTRLVLRRLAEQPGRSTG